MSKTYNSKISLKKNATSKTRAEMSRHPDGTRAKGLKKDYKGFITVASDRNRFGEVEEQSSRFRKQRRAVIHSSRARSKREMLQTADADDSE